MVSGKDLKVHEIITVEDRKIFKKAGHEWLNSLASPASLRNFSNTSVTIWAITINNALLSGISLKTGLQNLNSASQ